jgi:hypothetical protein
MDSGYGIPSRHQSALPFLFVQFSVKSGLEEQNVIGFDKIICHSFLARGSAQMGATASRVSRALYGQGKALESKCKKIREINS